MTPKKDFVPDYTPGEPTLCDMCEGLGYLEAWVEKKTGEPIYGSTATLTEADYRSEQRSLKRIGRLAKMPCSTCGGSGTMPEYLKPAYWQARARQTKEDDLPAAFWNRNLKRLGQWLQSL